MTTSHHIRLGPFELHTPIGKGGMGEVWRGMHADQRVPVAVKVVKGGRARRADYVDAFHNEVRAVAGLTHPGIVMVLDHGDILPEVEARSEGYFTAGSPYLVMEYASQGSLERLQRPLPWPELRFVLLNLLDALAHAHARGVIHRDIKPANILMAAEQDTRPGLKLSDFGIAHASARGTRSDSREETQGTPRYMAPEQFRGQWRDFGPWTDLYALGCVAYQLICGKPPFDGEVYHLIRGHLLSPPPPLEPVIEVPQGLQGWIDRLLQKAPGDRFVRAADAAWALIGLGAPAQGFHHQTAFEAILQGQAPPEPEQVQGVFSSIYDLDLLRMNMGEPDDEDGEPTTLAADAEIPESVRALGLDPSGGAAISQGGEIPPMPQTWQRPTPPVAPIQLVGAGLGLYGLRAIELVGRLKERDAIWESLLEVRRAGSPRLMLFEGVAGVGKSRLVDWMCERAHELGAATILRATHSPSGGHADGLGRMLARQLGCVGLSHDETLDRVRAVMGVALDDPTCRALAYVMTPSGDESPFASPAERHALIRRALERLTAERPVILWLDNVQWGQDALALAASLLEAPAGPPRPLLVLLTLRAEALQDETTSRKLIEAISADPSTSRHALGPLSTREQEELVRELLGLEGELVRRVAERTAGNPLFAVQIVGDWVQRGGLEVSEGGFRLRQGESTALPDDIHEVWCSHLEHLLADEPASASLTLEVAAVLGQDIINTEWQGACAQARIPLTVQLLFTLFSARLAIPQEDGWSFVHAMLRESLLRMARDAGRFESHNSACAAMLARLPSRPGSAERIGRHLIAAGRWAAALGPLLEAAAEHCTGDAYADVHRTLALRDHALDILGAPSDDARRAPALLLRAEVARLQGHFEDACVAAGGAARIALALGDAPLIAQTHIEIGLLAVVDGDLDGAKARFEQALALFDSQEDVLGQARAIDALGEVAFARNDLAAAMDHHERAQAIYQLLDHGPGNVRCTINMARACERAQQIERAMALYEQALALCQVRNKRFQIAVIHNGLGELYRFLGDLEAAEAHYRLGLDIQRDIGAEPNELMTWINLTLVLIARGRHGEALDALDALIGRFERAQWPRMIGLSHAIALPCVAALERWDDWARHIDGAEALDEGATFPDEAQSLQQAAEIAWEMGRLDDARRAAALAQRAWPALGRPDKALALDRLLSPPQSDDPPTLPPQPPISGDSPTLPPEPPRSLD